MNVLIVEDEAHLAEGLKFNVELDGMKAVIATDSIEAEKALSAGGLDAVVMDVMLPGKTGFEIVEAMRSRGDFTPVLMLTALGRPEDVLEGFAAGADDYLPKPFDLKIFLARLSGLIRRSEWSQKKKERSDVEDTISINGREIDLANLELRHDGEVIRLTLMEINLLKYLIRHEGTAVSRKTILEDVWGLQEDTDTRAIDNFIVRLRKYLEDRPNDPQIVQTVRGIGYKFVR